MRKTGTGVLVVPGWFAIAATAAAAAVDPDPSRSYLDEIKPVLEARCYACHGALEQKSGLRVDTAERLLAGGEDESRPVVVPGEPHAGELLRRLTSADPEFRMPPEGAPVESATVEAIRAWIAAGAPAPEGERGDDDPRDHWAFQPIERPPVPETGEAHAHPIDAFLEVKRRAHGVAARPEAERTLLLRRLHLDLVGLPPTLDQLADNRPYEAIVDELLAGPQHAERWARHWMDVWRYSDWYGLGDQLRHSQKHLWRWRDWIIESLAEDKGYDRMILEMLAGDELAPGDPQVVRATGFLARNYYLFNRTTWLDGTIEHTGKAFLGLTLDCAKCHDHKYDPIRMTDYYRVRAIFEPHQVRLDPVPGEPDLDADGVPRVFDAHPDEPTWIHRRGDPADPDTETPVEPGVPAIFADFAPPPPIEPVPLPPAAFAPGTRDHVVAERRRLRETAVAEAEQALDAVRARMREAEAGSASGDDEAPPAVPAFEIVETFDGAIEDLWETIGEGWEIRDGALHLVRAGRERSHVMLREPVPRDFEVVARYTTTGGATFKSVTFRFDLSEDERNANFVYTSAHEPDPKIQVAHTRNGADTYPPEGRSPRPIPIGEPVELRFAVRDRLVNVWLDGAFVLACRVPDRPPGGRFAFSGFDATVAFDSLAVRSLGADAALTEPGSSPAIAPEDALRIAEARVAAARAERAALEATVAADAARAGGSDETAHPDLARAAARRQAEAAAAAAKLEIAIHEAEAGDAAKRNAARDALARAEERLAKIAEGNDTAYQPLRAARQALESPAHTEADDPVIYPATSTGRRLMLARWIVSPDNPLTARVAVNHVWMRHFGEPLVETVADFGRRAKPPEHAELLDFLAAEFIESGWSFRHLHRLMVTSRAYRASSSSAGADDATRAADPANRLYWRAHPRRMESQVVRDSLLHLAGTLDLEVGGPSIDPKHGGHRRSLYFLHSRDQQDKFLAMFDDADHLQCYRRSESVVPQQALALANSAISLEAAAAIAGRLAADEAANDPFLEAAFLAILGRPPDADERQACRDFRRDLAALAPQPEDGHDADPDERFRTRLIHALLNHNDFVTIR